MKNLVLAVAMLVGVVRDVSADYSGWKHSGSVFVLTTPDGANLPGSAVVEEFPLLVRLNSDHFPFDQAKPNGDDVRFSTAAGVPLAYQIDEWNSVKGTASIWVRVPKITGNSRQEIKVHWGKPDAKSESNGKAVFNESNGFVSVWHMSGTVTDELGTLESKDFGTTSTAGMIGTARHFAGKQGIFCGDKIPNYPQGAASHSTEAWFRAEKSNATIIGWGNEGGGRGSKIRMQLRSPPHVHIDSDFSDVRGEARIPLGEWTHVVHTYDRGEGRVYINGKLDASAKPTLNIKSPSRCWIGGWYNNYDFIGDMDEVRISRVARSADWVRLQYENQKPMQTLVGNLVQPGETFDVAQSQLTVAEGKSVTLTAKAGGAQKVYWTITQGGVETVVATDRFAYTFDAGRTVNEKFATICFKAVYPNETKSRQVPVKVTDDIPEPRFNLHAVKTWDGRKPIEVVPEITNRGALQASGAAKLNYTWSITDIATIHEEANGKLILKRAQNSGPMKVIVAIDNGGEPTVVSRVINVTEPAQDPWIDRTPAKDEKPVDGQFYARNDKNEGMLHCNGTVASAAESVGLKVYADEKLVSNLTQKLPPDRSYVFAVKLKPGLIKYRVELTAKSGDIETPIHQAKNLVCGDAYIINGQSNAVATDFGKEDPTFRSEWIRTFGSMSGSPKGVELWGNAVHRSRDAEKLQIGYWGMELGRRLVEAHQVPICLINGAVGGTRIDQHQRNVTNPTDMTTIYGRLLWRLQQAKLTHGVRAIIWHQGENDQGADGPTGGYGWETYRKYFIDLAASWKQDYPNVQNYYVFQIWPKSCSMGINGSDNRLREVQRNLPTAFSRMSVMSTLGIDPPGGCHFPAAGYAEFARLICPLIDRDHYGKVPAGSITPPNLKRVRFASEKNEAIVLEFDQPVKWDDSLLGQFYLDGQKGKFVSAISAGKVVTLKLGSTTTAKTITYLDSAAWSQKSLLRGENGIAALTFCEVPIRSHQSTR